MRISSIDSTGTTSCKRAVAGVTSSLLKSTVSSTTTDYTPGVSSNDGTTNRFMHSGIKNADEQTGNNRAIAASRQYDAFGNLASSNQTWQGPFGYGGPYGYQTDPDHGLMLLGHRYYEADTGRFLTRDPIKDGRNWYGYCGGSPLTRADPEGQVWFVVAIVLVLAGGTAVAPTNPQEASKDWSYEGGKAKLEAIGQLVELRRPVPGAKKSRPSRTGAAYGVGKIPQHWGPGSLRAKVTAGDGPTLRMAAMGCA